MVSVKVIVAAGVAALISSAACAADLSMPPPMVAYPPAPAPVETGWYLRGDVGVGMQSFGSFDHSQTNAAFVWPASWTIVQQSIQDTALAGFGIGYEVNNWLRFDVTGEYRTQAMFKATGSYTQYCAGGLTCFDVNSGNLLRRSVHGQRLYRSRHLVVPDALRRRRRRRRLQPHHRRAGQRHQLERPGRLRLYPRRSRPLGASPGTFRPASPTTSATISRSISATVTSTSARRRAPQCSARIPPPAPAHPIRCAT